MFRPTKHHLTTSECDHDYILLKESETHPEEEMEEDSVQDEDWRPGSEELEQGTEEEERGSVRARNGEVEDIRDVRSEEEDDDMERGETEDENVPAATANANVSEGDFSKRNPRL